MKIMPVAGAGAIQDLSTPESVRTARAVAAFNKAQAPTEQAQEYPVPDANKVTAEDLSAIRASDNPSEEKVAEEAPLEPKPEEKKEDPALSRQFAQLARQERALRAKQQQQDQAFKTREAALAEREAALTSKPQFDPTKYVERSRLEQDALGVLEAEGITTYDSIAQRALSRQPIDPQLQAHINKLEAKLAALEEKTQSTQKSYEQQQQDAYQAAVKQIESDAKDLIRLNPNEYETIAKTNSVKDVVDLIKRVHARDGIVLSVEEAAQQVEEHISDELFKHSTNIEKIKKRMEASGQKTKSDEKKPASPQQQQMKTLTNTAASSRTLSAKERAILAFKGELKP